jgi:hypothetical protein
MVAIPPPSVNTRDLIYKAYEAAAEGRRKGKRLPASMIGRECERQLWLVFRWALTVKHAGRILRLFDTGNHEEPRLVNDLRRIGVTVVEVDPNDGRQWSVTDESGHFGGFMDAAGIGVPEAPATWHVIEFKTHSDKSFKDLEKKGVRDAKPEHYAQMQTYMHLAGMVRALYLAKNKNTDELYSERVYYDAAYSIRTIEKARRIVTSPVPPAGISTDPTFFKCKFCDVATICHKRQMPERNCRTCMHSTPVADGQWSCAAGNDMGDGEAALPCHRFIPALVPGDQVDVRGDSVVYKTANGEWVDDGRA